MRLEILLTTGVLLFLYATVPSVDSACPSDMVLITDYCIDRYPWPNKRGEKPTIALSGLIEHQDRNKREVYDARRLCQSVGKRVCTRTEWAAACKGPDGYRYPWGNELPRYRPGWGRQLPCNADKRYIVVHENAVWARDPKELAHLDQREESGERESCKSGYGVYDQIGQVEEWVLCPNYPCNNDCVDEKTHERWCLMGRNWTSPVSCDMVIAGHDPRWHYYETSTRCCKEAKL